MSACGGLKWALFSTLMSKNDFFKFYEFSPYNFSFSNECSSFFLVQKKVKVSKEPVGTFSFPHQGIICWVSNSQELLEDERRKKGVNYPPNWKWNYFI